MKEEGDAKERRRVAAEEAARKKVEDPILKAAAALLAKSDSAGACREMSKLVPERHAQLVLESRHFTYADLVGIECARRRSPLMFSTTQKLDEAARKNGDAIAIAREAQEANQPGVRERIGGGIGAGSIGNVDKKPSNAEILKGMTDYTYGSGKASSCPYQDKTLCNK